VTRQRNPDDERQVQVRLTPKGWSMREETVCLAEALLTRSGLTVAQIQALNGEVRRLRDAVAAPPA
jgi:DNA-binding MarR family transcriptional regulator